MLIIILACFAVVQIILTTLFYRAADIELQKDAERDIKDMLLTHRAIHGYVEDVQKPEIYRLKQEGKLYKSYFSPKVLSCTHTAHGIHEKLNKERVENGLPPIYFKLASTNPRNRMNTADTKEASLLEQMNQNLINEYTEYLDIDGEPYLHYAVPLDPNKESCMRCHGSPSSAPQELLAQYGDKLGFGERIGDIRALISIRVPLSLWQAEHHKTAGIFTITSLAAFISIYLAIFYFVRKIDLQEIELSLQKQSAILTSEKSSMLLRNIVNSMPSMLVGVDKDERINLWNRQAETASGVPHEVAIGGSVWQYCRSIHDVEEKIKATIEERGKLHLERIPYDDGNMKYLDIMVYPLGDKEGGGAVIRIDDITERARMEDIMVQTEKMMSVGGLAAGMAHEINNPLGGILQGTQNLERRLSPDLKRNIKVAQEAGTSLEAIRNYMHRRGLFEFIQGIKDSGLRASKIVENMLSFSRKTDSTMQLYSLNEIIDRTIELAWNDYDLKKKFDFRHIEIVKDYSPSIPGVSCVGTEIEQVILNLLKNASQAISDIDQTNYKGRIILRTRQHGKKAIIEIIDNGPGMEESVCKRVFEPFFTTKEVGVGTGLGLSVSYFIITENHRGSMSVSSTPGRGTVFTIGLPLDSNSRKDSS